MKFLGYKETVTAHTTAIINEKYYYHCPYNEAKSSVTITMRNVPLCGVIELVIPNKESTWYYFGPGRGVSERAIYRLETNIEILKYKTECINNAKIDGHLP